jgi:hypothetical protein
MEFFPLSTNVMLTFRNDINPRSMGELFSPHQHDQHYVSELDTGNGEAHH